jgi:hypothetical protein
MNCFSIQSRQHGVRLAQSKPNSKEYSHYCRAIFYTKGIKHFIVNLLNIRIKNAQTYSGSCNNQGLPDQAIFNRF